MSLTGMGRPIVPKEHGAWAVLFGAFLAGVGVAGQVTLPVLLFLVGITGAAFANGPLAILARWPAGQAQVERQRHALAWFLAYGCVAMAAFAPLFLVYRMTFLLPFGMGAAFFLLLRVYLVRERDERTLSGELAGTAVLTMVGAAAHAVAVVGVQAVGAVIWLLLFLFFASGVFYVRMRVHGMVAMRKAAGTAPNPARWPCVLYHTLLIIVIPALLLARVVPWPVVFAFAPALWRAATGLGKAETRLDLKRLGWSEVAVATAFVFLLIAAFRFTPHTG